VFVQTGFPHQRLSIVPRPIVNAALAAPVTQRLTVTDAGRYPSAAGHLMVRASGAPETIIIVCISGSGWVEIGGSRHHVPASTALVIPAGVPHAYGASTSGPWTIWWCHLSGSDVSELVAELGVTVESPGVRLRHTDRIAVLLDEIIVTLELGPSPSALIGAAGAGWKLLTQLIVDRSAPAAGEPVERAIDYLVERFRSAISVQELAELVGVSPSHLSAQFRRTTGGGVLAFQTSLRMARARHLLDTTTAPIGEIGLEVGYPDPLYFSRRFTRAHAMSPSEYRAKSKG
jgi:AraC-like DNA-binding protein